MRIWSTRTNISQTRPGQVREQDHVAVRARQGVAPEQRLVEELARERGPEPVAAAPPSIMVDEHERLEGQERG